MSKYTVQLRRIVDTFGRDEVESWFKNWELSDYLTQKEIDVINARGTFDKDKLAEMIVDTYYMREIGAETPALFRHYAKLQMREIMGRYAQLVYSAAIEIDPLVNENYSETFSRDANNDGSSTTTGKGSGFGLQSDTPQSQMNKDDLLAGKYGTNAQADEQETTNNTTAEGSNHEEYTRTVRGNRGISSNAPYLIQQYRDYIINIYGDIIRDCSVLFMALY